MSRCADCAYYAPINQETGNCNESPPKVFMVPVRTIQGEGIGFQSLAPQVPANHWCGAHSDFDPEEKPSFIHEG